MMRLLRRTRRGDRRDSDVADAITENRMEMRGVNAVDAPAAIGGYSQAVEVRQAVRTLYISGQIPVARNGEVPESFREQARLAWRNVEAQLRAADMTLDNLVRATIYLSDRRFSSENRDVRQEVLQKRAPALTVVIAGIFDTGWLLEIEAVACA
jgi:2-iminobutanoate/2-iminopropanoate deaminase